MSTWCDTEIYDVELVVDRHTHVVSRHYAVIVVGGGAAAQQAIEQATLLCREDDPSLFAGDGTVWVHCRSAMPRDGSKARMTLDLAERVVRLTGKPT